MRYLFEEYAFDTDRRELHRGADVVSVAPQVFDLLDYLIRNRERVVSKDDLIDAIWNGRIVSDGALTTRLNAARTAIGDSGEEQRLEMRQRRDDVIDHSISKIILFWIGAQIGEGENSD